MCNFISQDFVHRKNTGLYSFKYLLYNIFFTSIHSKMSEEIYGFLEIYIVFYLEFFWSIIGLLNQALSFLIF